MASSYGRVPPITAERRQRAKSRSMGGSLQPRGSRPPAGGGWGGGALGPRSPRPMPGAGYGGGALGPRSPRPMQGGGQMGRWTPQMKPPMGQWGPLQGGGQIPGYQPGMVRPPMQQPGYGLPQLPVNGGQLGGRLDPAMFQAMMQMLQRYGGGMQ